MVLLHISIPMLIFNRLAKEAPLFICHSRHHEYLINHLGQSKSNSNYFHFKKNKFSIKEIILQQVEVWLNQCALLVFSQIEIPHSLPIFSIFTVFEL